MITGVTLYVQFLLWQMNSQCHFISHSPSDVDVIELLVKEGDEAESEQSVVTLETDKVSMFELEVSEVTTNTDPAVDTEIQTDEVFLNNLKRCAQFLYTTNICTA